jgi:hypothetical protein
MILRRNHPLVDQSGLAPTFRDADHHLKDAHRDNRDEIFGQKSDPK